MGGLRPLFNFVWFLFYNKNMVQAAGINASKFPNTWQQLYALAPKLTNGQTYPMSVGWYGGPFFAYTYFLMWLNSTPTRVLSEDHTRVIIGDDVSSRGCSTICADEAGRLFRRHQPCPVVDQTALVGALQSGHLGGAALDVYETEPLPEDSPLRRRDSVVLTPHMAAYSAEAWADLRAEMCSTTIAFLRDGWAPSIVNPAVRGLLRSA